MKTGIIVAGGAGFIGSHLVRHFLAQGRYVLVLDNLCRGKTSFISDLPGNERLFFMQTDVSNREQTAAYIDEFHKVYPVTTVWHMAANSDIPAGVADSEVDLRDTFMTTHSLLCAMKLSGIKELAFASSSAIYGDHGPDVILDENTGPFFPISNYGAMKLASEAAISAAAESFLEKAWLFRFPNVVGPPATHGVLIDFIQRLQENPACLQVLGNGQQQKIYLHVSELVKAMLYIVGNSNERRNCFNIGPDDAGISVREIAEATVARVAPGARIEYGQGNRGWVGDVPRFRYSVQRLQSLGFITGMSSHEAVCRSIDEIARERGV